MRVRAEQGKTARNTAQQASRIQPTHPTANLRLKTHPLHPANFETKTLSGHALAMGIDAHFFGEWFAVNCNVADAVANLATCCATFKTPEERAATRRFDNK